MEKGRRQFALIILDILLIQVGVLFCFLLRFDGKLSTEPAASYLMVYFKWAILITVVKIGVYAMFQLYNSLWRYASVEELIQVVLAALFGVFSFFAVLYVLDITLPRSIVILSGIMDMLLLGAVRFGYRALRIVKDYGASGLIKRFHDKRILIVGAGVAGATLAKEIKNQASGRDLIVGFIDDDVTKQGRLINGITVLGDRFDILRAVIDHKVDEIIIALPSGNHSVIKEVVNICTQAHCRLRILPSLDELLSGQVTVNAIRNVEIDDLLGRDVINLDETAYARLIFGKIVMVTGAGGSIGSEIVRQVLKHKPAKVLMIDIYENNLYNLQQELLRELADAPLEVLIASVRDCKRIDELMERYRPQIIFHAAAHKHVPLMETSPKEAIKNNIFGTLNLITTAQKYEVERFVQISTDKAVNPTNVMGATKRACEMLIQAMNGLSRTELIAVRFGNVLGSDGSVIPLFKKQIADGGPVTVTHKDIIRYFMTIPEATRLVIQAASLGKGGEIFVLDMGEPIRIYELAEKMIRLSGFEPHRDIEIKVTGLRPGEKLFEELLIDDQHTVSTELDKIFVEKTTPLDWPNVSQEIANLKEALEHSENQAKIALSDMVKTYIYPR